MAVVVSCYVCVCVCDLRTCDDHHANGEHTFVVCFGRHIAEAHLFRIVQCNQFVQLTRASVICSKLTDVMHVIVKYSAVMYMVDLDGPLVSSVYSDESLCRK